MSTENKLRRAAEASRLLEEIGPILAKYETRQIEQALSVDRTTEAGTATANDCLRRVEIVREVRSELQVLISEGEHAARTEGWSGP